LDRHVAHAGFPSSGARPAVLVRDKARSDQVRAILQSVVELGDRVAEVRVGSQQIDARIEATRSRRLSVPIGDAA
jgi:hypothetical protein